MKNISFDNPYLLLLLIPLLVLLLVPIFIAIRRVNRTKSVVISTVLHILMAVCAVLALAGLMRSTILTKTQIYIVADVSYSSNRNLDEIDALIEDVRKNAPENAEIGVVVFAKEPKLLVEMGGEPLSVKDNHGFKHDVISGTDISSALNYTVDLFDENVIKRLVLITDGKETRLDSAGALVSAVENVYSNDIYLDAVYLDNNLDDKAHEVQITDVQFATSTYKNHQSIATILIESSYDTSDVNMDFLVDSVLESSMSLNLSKGYNIINFELPTSYAGRYDYGFTIRAKDPNDSSFNNTYQFTQEVVNGQKVLLVSWDEADRAYAELLYGGVAEIDAYIKNPNVPCSVEELCVYDEIILSNFDIRKLNNYTSFINSVDTVVSRFGKSLVTMGDLRIQNKEEEIFTKLEDMLPVKFGNSDRDPTHYAIVLDISHSIFQASAMQILKDSTIRVLNMLEDDDYVSVITFYGEIETLQTPARLGDVRTELVKKIDAIKSKQGTVINKALIEAKDRLLAYASLYSEQRVLLISDGATFGNEDKTPPEVAAEMFDHGIITTVIHPAGIDFGEEGENNNITMLQSIASEGGGSYYAIQRVSEIPSILFAGVADDLTESIIHRESPVRLLRDQDPVLADVDALPHVKGYAYAKAKASATPVLIIDYEKKSGNVVQVPLYTYWNYGNGRVSSFTSTLTGEWAELWMNDENGVTFFENVLATNTPTEHMDYPFTLNVQYDSFRAEVEIVPVTLNPKAICELTVTLPGEQVQETVTLPFAANGYRYRFDIPSTGKYVLDVTYRVPVEAVKEEKPNYGLIEPETDASEVEPNERVYTALKTFNIPYAAEYNSFEIFDPATLHAAIRSRGRVTEGVIPSLANDDKEIATYTIRYVVPLMIAIAVMYVVDIIIRKLKWDDLRTLFGSRARKMKRKGDQ